MPAFKKAYRIDRDRDRFLGSLMTRAGYQTQIVGKTHWHTDETFRAGFEGVYDMKRIRELCLKRTDIPLRPEGLGVNEMYPALSYLPPHIYETNLITDQCIDFLNHRDETQPFLLWASYQDPHPPNIIHEPYYSMYDTEEIPEAVMPDWVHSDDCPAALYMHRMVWNEPGMSPVELRKARGVYYGKITNLDHQLGRIFGWLKVNQLFDKTLILYSSDHGEHLGDAGDIGKSTLLESSASIPLIIKPPRSWNLEPGRVTDALVGWADLLPTFCEAVGMDAPSDITGKSLLPIIKGERNRVREYFHGQIENQHMLHDGEYKYLYFADDGKVLLFAAEDREDRHNLTGEKRDVQTRMRNKLIRHLEEESHEHVSNGELINLCVKIPSDAELKGREASGWLYG
jgi:arylsulfatase A-like enzyme